MASWLEEEYGTAQPEQKQSSWLEQEYAPQAVPPTPGNSWLEQEYSAGSPALPEETPVLTPDPMYQLQRDAEAMISGENPYSKALKNTLREAGGGVMKVLEPLDRPRSALVAALSPERGPGSVMQAFRGEIHPSWGELMPERIDVPSAGFGGFLGGGEAASSINIKPHLTFAADALLDPINLLQVGTLTKLGKSGKILGNLAKVHGDDLGKILGSKKTAEIFDAIRSKSPAVVDFLRSKGISDATIDVASKAVDALYSTLPEQARAGQWAAAKFGPVQTPRFVNVLAAEGVDRTRKMLPKTTLGKMFVNRTGDDLFDLGIEDVDRIHRARQNDIMATGADLRKSIDELDPGAFGGKSSAAWYESEGGLGLPGSAAVDPASESVKVGMAQKVGQLNRSQMDEMKRLGIPIEEIAQEGYAYAPHVAKERGIIDRMKGLLPSKKNSPSTFTPHKLHREYQWITDPDTGQEFIDSVSRYAHESGFPADSLVTRHATVDEINGALGKDFFKGDLAEAVTIASLRNERALHGARQLDFFMERAADDLAKIGGVDAAKAAGWRNPTLRVPERYLVTDGGTVPIKTKLSQLANTPMPPEKARFLEARWKEIAAPDEAMKGLKDLFTGYTSLWKRYTLFPFMEYHFRNSVGDMWNGWMHGWKPGEIPGDLMTAARMQLKEKPVFGFAPGEFTVKKAGVYGDLPSTRLLREAQDRGVVGTGQYGEVARSGLSSITSAEGKSFLKDQLWDLKTPVAFGAFFEDNRRLGLFSRLVKNGETFDDAARMVKKTLYDYNDLTQFEKGIRRWAVPFYTWYRKNIPAQIENLIRRPGKVAVLPKMKAAAEGSHGVDVPEELRPEWMRREFSIHTGTDPRGNEKFAVLGSYVPTADLFKFGGNPDDALTSGLSNINPLWKVPAEMAANKNIFFDRPVDMLRDEDVLLGNERTNFLGMNLPSSVVKASELLPFTRLLSTLDRLNPFGIFDSGEGYSPPYVRPGEEKTRPYHTEMSTAQKLLKTITGLKIYPTDVQRNAMYEIEDLKRDGAKSPGLTVSNLNSLAKKAIMEGDERSAKIYQDLLEVVLKKLDDRLSMIDRYEDSKNEN